MTVNIAVGAMDIRVALIDMAALENAILMEAEVLCAFHAISSNFWPASLAARRAADLAANSARDIDRSILFTNRLVTITMMAATV